jgi:MraZ protein
MKGYRGSYLHKIDEKGRLGLPAQFRRDGEQTLVLVHVFPENLSLFPEEAWAGVEENLARAMRGTAEERRWALRVTANTQDVTTDKQGRILVPQKMQAAVGIDGAALVVGALNKIELWNPERFEAVNGPVQQDDTLIREIFG